MEKAQMYYDQTGFLNFSYKGTAGELLNTIKGFEEVGRDKLQEESNDRDRE